MHFLHKYFRILFYDPIKTARQPKSYLQPAIEKKHCAE